MSEQQQPERNIIFLDIDGVVCTPRASVAVGDKGILTYLDPIVMGLLTKLVEDYNAEVVISSTWRQGRTFGDFHDLFAVSGFYKMASALPWERKHEIKEQVQWKTKQLSGSRGNEIKDWIDTYGPIKNYVILDDDSDMLDEQKENFVHVKSCHDGLSFFDYLKCKHIFDGKKLSEFKER